MDEILGGIYKIPIRDITEDPLIDLPSFGEEKLNDLICKFSFNNCLWVYFMGGNIIYHREMTCIIEK